jgi:hypothetical protein
MGPRCGGAEKGGKQNVPQCFTMYWRVRHCDTLRLSHGHSSKLNSFIFRYRVLREIPISLATLLTLP